jgi:chromosome segregation ATPase
MNEMDATLTSQNEKLNFLEQEKKAGRLDFDNSRRLVNERLSNLDAQVCNEMEAKKMWQDKYTKENQLLSKANIEVTELKNKLIETNSKVVHLEVELKGVTQQATNLASSKKELQLTLNNYIAQCNSLENELFTIKEVSLDYEKAKQEEFMHMNIKLEKYTLHLN